MDEVIGTRIDRGVKRGKRAPKSDIDRKPIASLSGHYRPPIDPIRKQEIINAAYGLMVAGKTTEEIGTEYGISGRCLRYWLINDDKAEDARKAMFDQELVRTGEEIREATEAIPLARAREGFRYWSWMAERRDSARYAQRQAMDLNVNIDLGSALQRIVDSRQAKLQEPEPVAVQQQSKPDVA